VHATDSFAVRVSDLAQSDMLMSRLRAEPPTTVAGVAVERTDDLSRGAHGLPPTEGLRYHLVDRSRIIVRPSGTEPKVKVYLEIIEPVAGAASLAESRAVAETRLARVREDFERLTSL
jgi:phosphomannomutase